MVNLNANRIDRLLGIAGWLLLAVAAAFVVYYVVTVPVEGSFGERFVTSEVSLFYPFNQVSVFKPITLITYFIFAGTVLLLEAYKKHVIAFDTRGVRAILLTASFASGYEVIWNFFVVCSLGKERRVYGYTGEYYTFLLHSSSQLQFRHENFVLGLCAVPLRMVLPAKKCRKWQAEQALTVRRNSSGTPLF